MVLKVGKRVENDLRGKRQEVGMKLEGERGKARREEQRGQMVKLSKKEKQMGYLCKREKRQQYKMDMTVPA